MFHNFRRDAAHDRVSRYVFRNDRACRNNGIVANGHALQDSRIGADPTFLPSTMGAG